MGFKVGQKYKIVDADLAKQHGVEQGKIVTVTAIGLFGDAWANEIYFEGELGSDREPKGFPELFTGIPVEKAGWAFAMTKHIEEGHIELVQDSNEVVH